MHTDVLIVGQGICGTMLSYFLAQAGKPFLVLDDERPNSATAAAAGIINPVTGRRYVYSWLIDTVMPFAVHTYAEMCTQLQVAALHKISIIDFFPSPQMRDAFATRLTEDDTYLHTFPDQNRFNAHFNFDFGCGEIAPAHAVSFGLLVAAWRQRLLQQNQLRAEVFVPAHLQLTGSGIRYNGITAETIIFCDGIAAADYPYWERLPFSANKGEALLIKSDQLPRSHIFKKGMMLVPLPVQHTFWFGSNYQWEFENHLPSEAFYKGAKSALQNWLKVPFEILAHKAAVRPATLERRPFVGLHPQHRAVGILNGMGAKGSALAPYFAHQLAQHLVSGAAIHPDADVNRFQKILSK